MRRSEVLACVATLIALPAVAAFAEPPAAAPDPKAAAAEKRRQGEALFQGHDKNRDGNLRGDEIPKNWAAAYDLDGDADVSKREFMEIWTHSVLKAGHPLRHAGPRAAKTLRDFDRDKDGAVSMEEFPGTEQVFKGADRDKDGQLSPKELLRLAKEELESIEKQLKNPSRYDLRTLFDLNGDRQITSDEYDGPRRAFDEVDADRDGILSYDELYPERMMERTPVKPQPEDKNVIESMDADADGRVSREEFKGTDAAWKRLDRNRDGYLTASDSR
jgi:Ca2+-binding EF-hand superfamily protein